MRDDTAEQNDEGNTDGLASNFLGRDVGESPKGGASRLFRGNWPSADPAGWDMSRCIDRLEPKRAHQPEWSLN